MGEAPPALSLETLADLARRRLHPLTGQGAYDPRPRSDYDLDAVVRPPSAGLSAAAVLIGVYADDGDIRVLLTRRSDALRRHSGQVAFPGGRLEPGEAPIEAALRESEEEVGLARSFVEPWGLADPYETGTGFWITPVVAGLRPGFDLVADAREVAEIFSAPFHRLMDLSAWEMRRVRRDGADRRFYALEHEGRTIWGATAGMIRALAERLFED